MTNLIKIGLFVTGVMLFFASKVYADTIWIKKSDKSQVEVKEAVLGTLKGEEYYKCALQESKISEKTGSIGVRNVKKKLSQDEIDNQIKELKKRLDK